MGNVRVHIDISKSGTVWDNIEISYETLTWDHWRINPPFTLNAQWHQWHYWAFPSFIRLTHVTPNYPSAARGANQSEHSVTPPLTAVVTTPPSPAPHLVGLRTYACQTLRMSSGRIRPERERVHAKLNSLRLSWWTDQRKKLKESHGMCVCAHLHFLTCKGHICQN